MFGCAAPQSLFWMEKGATLTNYKIFAVLPAQNETGKTFDVDVGAILTEQLVSKLRAKDYTVHPEGQEPQDGLMLKSSIVKYESGSSSAELIVRTTLTDKKTGKLLAELVTAHSASAGRSALGGALIGPLPALVGLAIGLTESQSILDTVATGIVDELDRRIQKHD